jgi:hypothetical protein
MMSIEVHGEFGQVDIWDSQTSNFSDWTGYEDQPFARTNTAIQISTDRPYGGESISMNVLSLNEMDKLNPGGKKIFSGNVEIPSGKLNVGDTIVETYLQFEVDSLSINLTVYVDTPGFASHVDIIIEEDILRTGRLHSNQQEYKYKQNEFRAWSGGTERGQLWMIGPYLLKKGMKP